MTSIRIAFLFAGLLATGAVRAQSDAEVSKPEKLTDYTCWQLLTEPEESQGVTEVFFLGYALGRAGLEFADEASSKAAVAAVIKRCQAEPDAKVLDVFAAALKPG